MPTKDEVIAARRASYEALKANGRAPKALPGPSERPAPPIDEAALIHRETVPGGWYWTTKLAKGEILRLQTGDAPSCVALVAWRADDTSERLNCPDTVKVQWTSALAKGRVVFSEMGRVMLSIVEDSSGCHDAIVGGSTARSNEMRYGDATLRNTRENFLIAAQKLGLGERDVPGCLSFFAPVRVDADGRFVWHEARRTGGDYVELRAELDLFVAISNCPHPLDPAPVYAPAPIEATRFRGGAVAADDLCRTATDEARRGFDNNAALAL
jgi:uncharacterized protein